VTLTAIVPLVNSSYVVVG